MPNYIRSLLDKVLGRGNDLRRLDDLLDGRKPVAQSNPVRGARANPQSALAEILPTRSGSTGVTFSVDKVERAPTKLPETSLLENLKMRCGTSLLVLPEQASPVVGPPSFLANANQALLDRHRFLNPLIEAVHLAFSGHRPLVISPDCIWLTIVQGFSHHVHANAEALRGRIVRHEGEKELRVRAESLRPEAWPYLISELSAQIRDNSDPVLYETLLCDFSTTTPNIKVANEIALMDAYQRYFRYLVDCVCGIPAITLEGSPDDWQRIRERIEVLTTYGLEWWTTRLAPILDKFVATANGAPDLAFWQAIYKPQRAYAIELATGWITDLFPYLENLEDTSQRFRNPMLGVKRSDWVPVRPEKQRYIPGVDPETFPCGLSSAPVTLTFPNEPAVEVNVVGGFVGVSQAENDLSLAPMISWGVAEKDKRVERGASAGKAE